MPEDDLSAPASYRGWQAGAVQLAALALLLAPLIALVVLAWPDWRAVLGAAAIGPLVLLIRRATRANVRADADGVEVLDQWGERVRLCWSEIERFNLERNERELPHAYARLTDGRILELEPLEGADLQPRRSRWRAAERSIENLNHRLEAATGRAVRPVAGLGNRADRGPIREQR